MELLGGKKGETQRTNESTTKFFHRRSEAVCCRKTRYDDFVTLIRRRSGGHEGYGFLFLFQRKRGTMLERTGMGCSYCGEFTFKSSTSVGVISDGSINGVGRDERAPLADGVGLTIPAHCGGSPT